MVGDAEECVQAALPVTTSCGEDAPMADSSLGKAGRRFSARLLGKRRQSEPGPSDNIARKMEVEGSVGGGDGCFRNGAAKSDHGEAATTELPTAKVATRSSPRLAEKQRPNCSEKQPEKVPRKEIVKMRAIMDLSLMQATNSETKVVLGKVDANAQSSVDGVGGTSQNGAVKSDHMKVKEALRVFNSHYLHFVQAEEHRVKQVEVKQSANCKAVKVKVPKKKIGGSSDDEIKRGSKRPDLKAISKMKENRSVLYPEKRIGHLPGIDVGHQFYSRAEMVVLGVHSHWLSGIDYMGMSYAKQVSLEKYKGVPFPLAVCIVLSGMYEDDTDNADEILYTGQGGHDLLGNKQQIKDQKLGRGNLALKNNFESGLSVRVVRGHESRNSYCGKVYTYDGLYKVVKYWAEKGVRGFTVFKYKLKRLEGQPLLTTSQVFFARAHAPRSISNLRGLVCEDLSGGQENIPIPVTNVIDDPPVGPIDFVYQKSMQFANNLKLPTNCLGCQCKGGCSNPRACACAQLNGNDFPYVQRDGGRLIEAKSVVFECGPNCGCNVSCVNRISQQGIKYHLEVFRTPSKGWGVRSWDTIPSGAPICEYTGILTKTDDMDNIADNSYIFEIDCLQTMKGLDGRETRPGDVSSLINLDDKRSEVVEYCIDAGSVGNVARFINHSCQPNLFVQCILSSHHDMKMAKVMLFAADTIPPLEELTYDYGYALDSVVGADGKVVKMPCHCGAVDCRKWLY
ncbi:histone-lysine N-methyltransferase, H3 lysine-9 specific SUVH4-like isoform X1 [Zingiber officinale]|uniref:histone-lysine N-methyltransferase, H3 lysine-9 specific SUVH4-like isoform X1 n=1 Tax=Zingiber officinale TaxID=94328 RepID=UPI001C4AA418|nr:histone-lysine N-methyltransferase, H3 lysine-9 specific SUVH4-like isoform X1 [Zingiber officinale]